MKSFSNSSRSKACIYCGSSNIRDGIPFNSMVTLKTDPFTSHQTFAEVCMDCGTILRNYIELKKLNRGIR
ncbi:hypothetical protein [Alkaliphilus transvaalensis]|uniref:hypothetical protein n=1 Tax=Alkaliphilus transvaalensis TaxID=114628 RepID=UPI00047DA58A|nr:hypothetical protein [Alkaliphilus transvaalensis]